MILPWLKGILDWDKVPMTWMLLALNVFFFYSLIEYDQIYEKKFSIQKNDVYLTGALYQQYIHQDRILSRDELYMLGSKALRDPQFLEQSEKVMFKGDPIAIGDWKKEISEYKDNLQKRRSKIFGLSFEESRWTSWITYQFTHANFMHLLGNMLMLLIFGSAIEAQLGGWGVMLLYLIGGLLGGYGFLFLSASSVVPMVGASGSISTLMCFYVLMERKKRVKYIYFLSPIEKYYGIIYLPTWIIIPMNLLTDIASQISTSVEMGQTVAHSAHIGGGLIGLLLGGLYRWGGDLFSVSKIKFENFVSLFFKFH